MEKSDRLLLRIAEVAQMIGVSRSLVYAMAAKGELPTIRIRGGLRVPADSLRVWIAQKVEEAAVDVGGDVPHGYNRDVVERCTRLEKHIAGTK
jgi:excisionase family DNA binding protein